MTRLGAVFVPQLPPERLQNFMIAADQSGLDDIWLWEDCFLESGIAAASAALAWTERVQVGVGLLPVPLRNVALTAMETATLQRLFPGRVHIGIGHGVQSWMGQVGARAESPMTLLAEYLEALRLLLKGEQVTVNGRYVKLDRVKLDWPPSVPAPIWAGGVGPRTLALAAKASDGIILTGGTTPEETAQVRALAGDLPIAVYVHGASGPDAPQRLEAERVRWGYPSLDGRAATGDVDEFAASLRRWANAGATRVIVQPTPDDPDVESFLHFLGTEIKTRLQ